MLTKKAAVLPAAMKSKLRTEAYQKSKPLSSLKLRIGELLLFDNKERRELWSLFEVLLMQYVDLRLLSQNILGPPGSENCT